MSHIFNGLRLIGAKLAGYWIDLEVDARHGGEGLKAEQNYERFSSLDKDALVRFVNSL
jgi:hypothetical protein